MGMVVGGRAGGGEKEWESRGNGGIEISGRNSSAYFSGGYTPPIYAVSGEERRGETSRAKGVLARTTGTRKALPAAENKLGGFKNFAASASPDPLSHSFSFCPSFFFFLFLSLFFRHFSLTNRLYRSTLLPLIFSFSLFPPHFSFVSLLLLATVRLPLSRLLRNNTVLAISRKAVFLVRPPDASRGHILF